MTEARDLFPDALDMLGRSAVRLEFHHRVLAPYMPLDADRLASLEEPARTRLDVQATAVTDAWKAVPELVGMLAAVRNYVVQTGLIAADELPPYPPTA